MLLQRRVQHVAKENEFYMQLINLALPPETNNHTEATERPSSRGMAFEKYSYMVLVITKDCRLWVTLIKGHNTFAPVLCFV